MPRHFRKFENVYKKSPQEFHSEFAFPKNAKCAGCQAKPSVRALVMIPLDEAEKRGMIPLGASKAPLTFPSIAPVLVPIGTPQRPEYYIRISNTYSCSRCRKDFEKALASAPSWAIVEINEGPNYSERVVSGYS